MAFTVFYAWQSDRPANINHQFILRAAKAAITRIANDATVEESPRIDHDTYGLPGMPDVPTAILEKIAGCGIFLADVTFVGKSDESPSKLLPNPNVMIELGYALRGVGAERVICVFNEAFGKREQLPFDLRSRRWPIPYSLTESGGQGEEEQADALAMAIEREIRAIVKHGGLGPNRKTAARTQEELTAIRSGLDEGVMRGDSYFVSMDGGAMAVSVLPEKEQRIKDWAKRAQQLTPLLVPLGGGSSNWEIHGRRFRTFCVPRTDERSAKRTPRLNLADLHENATIYSVWGWDRELTPTQKLEIDGQPAGYVPSIAFEKEGIEAVSRYHKAMRALNVEGPWYVGVSLLRLPPSIMFVSRGVARPYFARVFEGANIQPDLIALPADAEEDFQALARLLRPAFDHVWREFGYPESLNYGADGSWRGQG